MMRFDDFDVVALAQRARRRFGKLEHDIHADRHVRRDDQRDALRGTRDLRLLGGRESGRANDDRLAERRTALEVSEGALRAGEVDQHVRGLERRADIV